MSLSPKFQEFPLSTLGELAASI
jgi:hypothetical protein